MGHDISGYKPTDKENEIAYLRRGAFSDFGSEIYTALDCQDCNGGVSGNGQERSFNKEQLKKALLYLSGKEELTPECKFICDCISNLDESGNIIIGFY